MNSENSLLVEESQPIEEQLNNMFTLVFSNETASNRQFKRAHLSLTAPADYESLLRPNETLIRVQLTCTDGTFEKEAKILVKIEDLNDNRPIFINQTGLVINAVETSEFNSIDKMFAIDMDLSRSFGNESLIYSIEDCQPDAYGFYIDPRAGTIYSKFLLR